jgi:hypothetical protein
MKNDRGPRHLICTSPLVGEGDQSEANGGGVSGFLYLPAMKKAPGACAPEARLPLRGMGFYAVTEAAARI